MKEDFKEEQYQEIEAYLLGNLDEAERVLFEAKVNEQVALQELLAEYTNIDQGIHQFYSRQILNQVVQDLEAEGFFIDEQDIENYFLGKLEAEKAPIFEKKLQSDPLFAQQVADFEAMIQGINNFQRDNELKASLQKLGKELEQESFFATEPPTQTEKSDVTPNRAPQRRRLILIYRLSIAASFILLLSFVVWMLTENKLRRIESLAIRSTLPEETILRKVINDLNQEGFIPAEHILAPDSLKKGLSLYQQKEFEQAYQQLKAYVKLYPQVEIGQFYFGVSSLHMQDFKSAEQSFKIILKNEKSDFRADAQWFLAIVELRTNPTMGKQHIKDIAKEDRSPFQGTAQALVDRFKL